MTNDNSLSAMLMASSNSKKPKEATNSGDAQAITEGAVQRDWKVPSEFPLCPRVNDQERSLEAYMRNLNADAIFATNGTYTSLAVKWAMTKDGKALVVMTKSNESNPIKPFALARIEFENDLFVHINRHTYRGRDGAEKYFTIEIGEEWTGGDVFDDFC